MYLPSDVLFSKKGQKVRKSLIGPTALTSKSCMAFSRAVSRTELKPDELPALAMTMSMRAMPLSDRTAGAASKSPGVKRGSNRSMLRAATGRS